MTALGVLLVGLFVRLRMDEGLDAVHLWRADARSVATDTPPVSAAPDFWARIGTRALGAAGTQEERSRDVAKKRGHEVLAERLAQAEREGQGTFATLRGALRDPSRDVRESAIEELESRGDRYAGQALLGFVSSESDAELRAQAIEALAEIGGPEGAEGVKQGLSDPDPAVQEAAADALDELADEGGAASVATLVEALRNADPEVRSEAISGLEEMAGAGDSSALQALGQHLRQETDTELREATIDALDYLGGTEALRALASHLTGEADADLRVRTVEVIENFEGAEAVAALLQALEDASTDVREASLDAIYHLDDASAVEALARRYRQEPDPYLQDQILSLLDYFEADPSILFD